MGDAVVWILIGLATLVLAAGLSLFVVKAIRRTRVQRTLRRHNRYVDLIGDMLVRNELRRRSLRRLAKAKEFRAAILEYLRFLDGEERDRLVELARRIGMVEKLLEGLRSPDRDRRARSVEGLAEIADVETLAPLVFALRDPVPEIQVQAASALARIGDPRAVRSILSAMDQAEPWAAQRFADALFQFGRDAVGGMTAYLTTAGTYRPLVARVLGLLGDLRAEPALIQSLSSDDLELRTRAAAALGRAGTPQSVPYLLDLLRDDRWEVRAQAATALGGSMDRAALPGLEKVLADQAWWVRHNAAAALVEIPGGVEALREALDHPDPYARDAAAAVLLSSGIAQSAIDDYETTDPLSRDRARQLIQGLLQAGKTDYFLQAGVDKGDLDRMRLGL